jgi:hypothetical protein
MEKVARLAVELGFDGVDINMGCPDRTIEKQGCGAAMIKKPELAREIIETLNVFNDEAKNSEDFAFWLPRDLVLNQIKLCVMDD